MWGPSAAHLAALEAGGACARAPATSASVRSVLFASSSAIAVVAGSPIAGVPSSAAAAVGRPLLPLVGAVPAPVALLGIPTLLIYHFCAGGRLHDGGVCASLPQASFLMTSPESNSLHLPGMQQPRCEHARKRRDAELLMTRRTWPHLKHVEDPPPDLAPGEGPPAPLP